MPRARARSPAATRSSTTSSGSARCSRTCRSTGIARGSRTRSTWRRCPRLCRATAPNRIRRGAGIPAPRPTRMPRRRTIKRAAATAPRGGVLLATEGRTIPKAAVERAAELANEVGAPVHVFAIARIYGVAFGLPSPWLRPNAQEWQAHRDSIAQAIDLLERRGVEADGNILGTRKATKRIVGEADRLGCTAIVMAADPPRNRIISDLMWSQEPYRVQRRAKVPVHFFVGRQSSPSANAPWGAGRTHLRERLRALGLPALPVEGKALHTHEHLDLYLNGTHVAVPADIGIDPQR